MPTASPLGGWTSLGGISTAMAINQRSASRLTVADCILPVKRRGSPEFHLPEDGQTHRFASAGELVTGDIETIPTLSLCLNRGRPATSPLKYAFQAFPKAANG
jgi:hypothetical protein